MANTYIYIPGFTYKSRGPLLIDKIELSVTTSEEGCTPVIYTFYGDDKNTVKGNAVYRVAPRNMENGSKAANRVTTIQKDPKGKEFDDYVSYDSTNVANDLMYRFPTGFCDYMEGSNGEYIHYITCNNTGDLGSAKELTSNYSDQNDDQHDGLFVIDVQNFFNINIYCTLTFYSFFPPIRNSAIGLENGTEKSTGCYVKLGTYSFNYNPAAYGAEPSYFVAGAQHDQYISVNEPDRKFEIPINGQLPIYAIDDNNYQLKTYNTKTYSYDTTTNSETMESVRSKLLANKKLIDISEKQRIDWFFGSEENYDKFLSGELKYFKNGSNYFYDRTKPQLISFRPFDYMWNPANKGTIRMSALRPILYYTISRDNSNGSDDHLLGFTFKKDGDYSLKGLEYLFPTKDPKVNIRNDVFDSKMMGGFFTSNLFGNGGNGHTAIKTEVKEEENQQWLVVKEPPTVIYDNDFYYDTINLNEWIAIKKQKGNFFDQNPNTVTCKIDHQSTIWQENAGALIYAKVGSETTPRDLENNEQKGLYDYWFKDSDFCSNNLKNSTHVAFRSSSLGTNNDTFDHASTNLQWFQFPYKVNTTISATRLNNWKLQVTLIPTELCFLSTLSDPYVKHSIHHPEYNFTYHTMTDWLRPFVVLEPTLVIDYSSSYLTYDSATKSKIATNVVEINDEGQLSNSSFPITGNTNSTIKINTEQCHNYTLEGPYQMPSYEHSVKAEVATTAWTNKDGYATGTYTIEKWTPDAGYYLVKCEAVIVDEKLVVQKNIVDAELTVSGLTTKTEYRAAIIKADKEFDFSTITWKVPIKKGEYVLNLSCNVYKINDNNTAATTQLEKTFKEGDKIKANKELLDLIATGSLLCACENVKLDIWDREYHCVYAPQDDKRVLGFYTINNEAYPEEYLLLIDDKLESKLKKVQVRFNPATNSFTKPDDLVNGMKQFDDDRVDTTLASTETALL